MSDQEGGQRGFPRQLCRATDLRNRVPSRTACSAPTPAARGPPSPRRGGARRGPTKSPDKCPRSTRRCHQHLQCTSLCCCLWHRRPRRRGRPASNSRPARRRRARRPSRQSAWRGPEALWRGCSHPPRKAAAPARRRREPAGSAGEPLQEAGHPQSTHGCPTSRPTSRAPALPDPRSESRGWSDRQRTTSCPQGRLPRLWDSLAEPQWLAHHSQHARRTRRRPRRSRSGPSPGPRGGRRGCSRRRRRAAGRRRRSRCRRGSAERQMLQDPHHLKSPGRQVSRQQSRAHQKQAGSTGRHDCMAPSRTTAALQHQARCRRGNAKATT
mmetsp:Transcript_68341/g.222237  ORF Transcript_68341/g.222237 Transcript_68341/m.222237 type:complete len:325 (-) Transcript_68341:774-1748(-)